MIDVGGIPLAVDVLRMCRCSDCRKVDACGMASFWLPAEWKYCLDYDGPRRSRQVITMPRPQGTHDVGPCVAAATAGEPSGEDGNDDATWANVERF